jgi:hypothetical protein
MRSSSPRLRFGGAIAATSLSLLVGLGGTAFAEGGQGDVHRSDRAGARSDGTVVLTEDTDTNDGGTANNVVDAGDNEHPSGNDRSVENGGSGNQGNATSEPDQNGSGPERDNGGLDQPGGPGGADLADQDGNNGCGNDDDFEDDNEGLCGGKPAPATTVPPVVVTPGTVTPGVTPATVTPGSVLSAEVEAAAPSVPTQVLGVTLERPAATAMVAPAAAAAVRSATEVRGATLARTGFGTGALVVLAIGLLLAGFSMVRRSKGSHFTA